MPVSALDAEAADQPVEYVCPRCDGVVAREDTVCPHCGQALEAVAAEADERPVPSTRAAAVAARRVNLASLPGRIVGVIVGFLLLLVGVAVALTGLAGVLIAGSDRDMGTGIAGFVMLGVGVLVGWVGVAVIRLAWSSG